MVLQKSALEIQASFGRNNSCWKTFRLGSDFLARIKHNDISSFIAIRHAGLTSRIRDPSRPFFLISVRPRQPTLTADNHGKATLKSSTIAFTCSSDKFGNSNVTYTLRLKGSSAAVAASGQNPSPTGKFTVQASSLADPSGTYECVAEINGVSSSSSNPVTVHVVGKMPLFPRTLNDHLSSYQRWPELEQ